MCCFFWDVGSAEAAGPAFPRGDSRSTRRPAAPLRQDTRGPPCRGPRRSLRFPPPPPVHVPVSFMCPTLAEIRAGEPVLRGPGWQPLADLQTRERWPHAAHGFLSAVQLPLGKAG